MNKTVTLLFQMVCLLSRFNKRVHKVIRVYRLFLKYTYICSILMTMICIAETFKVMLPAPMFYVLFNITFL